jgi:hypothetical protein
MVGCSTAILGHEGSVVDTVLGVRQGLLPFADPRSSVFFSSLGLRWLCPLHRSCYSDVLRTVPIWGVACPPV